MTRVARGGGCGVKAPPHDPRRLRGYSPSTSPPPHDLQLRGCSPSAWPAAARRLQWLKPLRVARGGCGVKSPPLAARPAVLRFSARSSHQPLGGIRDSSMAALFDAPRRWTSLLKNLARKKELFLMGSRRTFNPLECNALIVIDIRLHGWICVCVCVCIWFVFIFGCLVRVSVCGVHAYLDVYTYVCVSIFKYIFVYIYNVPVPVLYSHPQK